MALVEASTAPLSRPGVEPAATPAEHVDLRVLGARLNALRVGDILDICQRAIAERSAPRVIASQNMHGLHTYLTDSGFRALHEHDQTLVHIDGTPLLWMGKLKGYDIDYEHRTGCIYWVPEMFDRAAEEGWRVFYLGSTPDVADEGLRRIRQAHPGLDIVGRDGFFDADPMSEENRAVVEEINAAQADILLVGMGMGRQERWILQNLQRLDVRVVVTTGAMMELIAGTLNRAPEWLGPLGLEWAFRLYDNAPAVARRYFVEPWLIGFNSLRRSRRRRRTGSRR